ncbi:MAG TPA: phosphotransferase, partial [Hyphomicrobiales bacterium]|nr:phosphotransferase [Hyphomicrobiales bacterium]
MKTMNTPWLEIVPLEYREAACAGLAGAFGASATPVLQVVTGGASGALTYRAEASGKAYLLRIETRRTPMRNPHQYACMQIAADAGIAPALHYVEPDAGVAVMDFIAQRPLTDYPGGPQALVEALGGLAARLQRTPAFPPLHEFPKAVERIFGFVRNSRLFVPGLLDPHAAAFERIRAAYRWDESSLVSSHNDSNAQNVLFDGERLWLVDWETSYRNDPLTDVAIMLENFAPTPELERSLVTAWLCDEPDDVLLARLALMRQFTRLYYASLLLSLAAMQPCNVPEAILDAPTPEEFGAAALRGEHSPGSPATLFTL